MFRCRKYWLAILDHSLLKSVSSHIIKRGGRKLVVNKTVQIYYIFLCGAANISAEVFICVAEFHSSLYHRFIIVEKNSNGCSYFVVLAGIITIFSLPNFVALWLPQASKSRSICWCWNHSVIFSKYKPHKYFEVFIQYMEFIHFIHILFSLRHATHVLKYLHKTRCWDI